MTQEIELWIIIIPLDAGLPQTYSKSTSLANSCSYIAFSKVYSDASFHVTEQLEWTEYGKDCWLFREIKPSYFPVTPPIFLRTY